MNGSEICCILEISFEAVPCSQIRDGAGTSSHLPRIPTLIRICISQYVGHSSGAPPFHLTSPEPHCVRLNMSTSRTCVLTAAEVPIILAAVHESVSTSPRLDVDALAEKLWARSQCNDPGESQSGMLQLASSTWLTCRLWMALRLVASGCVQAET
ncbi:hypothetical protein MRB53_038650 [Persea americana]|nr:hypothetical protein MRB53_038650 [Persea americana]